jgi:adenylate kinase family enzyme
MINRIHILGASGSGTTTLASIISKKSGYKHIDTDDYYWVKTEPPFTQKRKPEERIKLLSEAMQSCDKWILSGSLCGWGDVLIPLFDLVIYLWIPQDVRMERLKEREFQRYGNEIKAGGKLYDSHLEFMEWASQYDTGDMNIRSKKLHYTWLNSLPCQVIKIEEDLTIDKKVRKVESLILET